MNHHAAAASCQLKQPKDADQTWLGTVPYRQGGRFVRGFKGQTQTTPCLQTESTPCFWDLQLHPADESVRPCRRQLQWRTNERTAWRCVCVCVWLPRRAGLLCHEQCMGRTMCVTSPGLLLFLGSGIMCMQQPAGFGYLCRSWRPPRLAGHQLRPFHA